MHHHDNDSTDRDRAPKAAADAEVLTGRQRRVLTILSDFENRQNKSWVKAAEVARRINGESAKSIGSTLASLRTRGLAEKWNDNANGGSWTLTTHGQSVAADISAFDRLTGEGEGSEEPAPAEIELSETQQDVLRAIVAWQSDGKRWVKARQIVDYTHADLTPKGIGPALGTLKGHGLIKPWGAERGGASWGITDDGEAALEGGDSA